MEQHMNLLTDIARRHGLFDSLETQRTSADFREVAVWCVKYALLEAYFAGQAEGTADEKRRQASLPTRKRRRTLAEGLTDCRRIRQEVAAGKTVKQACQDNQVSVGWYYNMARMALKQEGVA